MTKALRLDEGNLSLVSVPSLSVSKADEVIIRVCFSGIGGTDLQILKGNFPSAKSVILGHEFGGVISEVGEAVKNVSVGDKVAVNPSYSCGSCRRCLANQEQFCLTGSLHLTIGIKTDGGWAQYCRVPANAVFKLPDGMTCRDAVLADPLACVLRGIERLSPAETTADILICGAGTIGILFALVLQQHGHRHITITEISESRQKFAQQLVTDWNVKHPDEIAKEWQKAVDDGNHEFGFDIVIDATGEPSAINQAITFLRPGGKLCMFGTCPSNSTIQLNALNIVVKELSILGATNNPFTFTHSLQMLSELGSTLFSFNRLGIKEFEIDNYKEALDCLTAGSITKAVFKIGAE